MGLGIISWPNFAFRMPGLDNNFIKQLQFTTPKNNYKNKHHEEKLPDPT